ncbi:MAG: undecaprenyldiphospho-muramoylpentapeptide beta-N-acetylglucosaminyltransferase [Desulfobulbaceae bacterium]|nr:undecaprenyldiphospho-muramoylpentapeptide beta-N-acetylglucosaminyltransferase [Desulfobulbaceae bacterium]
MNRKDTKIRLLLTGGGTGGHLFPAVATAQEFLQQMPESEILFVGTKRKVDAKSLAAYGFASESIHCYGLKGKSPLKLVKALAVLPFSCLQALMIILRFKPDIILGVGGYVTGPVVAAAKSQGIPIIIHEQNSVPGLANRKLGRMADRVCLSLPGSGEEFPSEKILYTGNPVRSKILELAGKAQHRVSGKRTLLILGGSQGAQAVNSLVIEALCSLTDADLQGLKVIHQTGDRDEEQVCNAYQQRGIDAEVAGFFMNMHEVYEQADLLVSRAGATTLSEIAVLGKPAILIPYPSAADNHQEKNGQYYVSGGGAVQFTQKELTDKQLSGTILQLMNNEEKLAEMGAAMKRLSFPDAAQRIVACCLEEIDKSRA